MLMTCMAAVPATVSARASSENQLYTYAQYLYTKGEYVTAISAFEQLVKVAPDVARYHHSLGKAYGRLASESKFIRAMRFAKKARRSLELAVSLDSHSAKALSDLALYYERAPKFLGGDKNKAEQARLRLAHLCKTETIEPDVCDGDGLY